MVRTLWKSWLWPGLPQLWYGGSWGGLMTAVAFAGAVNLMLIATFGWTEWMPAAVRYFGWSLIGAGWLTSLVMSARLRPSEANDGPETSEDLFQQAQGEYLKGNWYEAELALNRLLRRDGHDLEARLMMASLLRHTRRVAEAGDQLRRLERCDGSEKWQLEIEDEWARLNTLAEETEENEPGEEEIELVPVEAEVTLKIAEAA